MRSASTWAQHALDVQARGGGVVAGGAADFCVGGAAEIALMIEVQQLAALVAVEEQAFGVEQLQRVVFRRIVRGGDGDAAARAGGADVDLDGGRGQDADIHHFAAGREQAAGDRVMQHLAAGRACRGRPPRVPRRRRCRKPARRRRPSRGVRKSPTTPRMPETPILSRCSRGIQAKLLTSSISASNNSRGGSPRCSQITRTIGSVWLTRTWNQRPGQSTRRPSSTFARPSAIALAQIHQQGGDALRDQRNLPFQNRILGITSQHLGSACGRVRASSKARRAWRRCHRRRSGTAASSPRRCLLRPARSVPGGRSESASMAAWRPTGTRTTLPPCRAAISSSSAVVEILAMTSLPGARGSR